jgi:hypothetical protein
MMLFGRIVENYFSLNNIRIIAPRILAVSSLICGNIASASDLFSCFSEFTIPRYSFSAWTARIQGTAVAQASTGKESVTWKVSATHPLLKILVEKSFHDGVKSACEATGRPITFVFQIRGAESPVPIQDIVLHPPDRFVISVNRPMPTAEPNVRHGSR